MVWQLQVRNPLRANHLLGYVDGSIPQPSDETFDEESNSIPNPKFLELADVDNQLVNCLNVIISPAILPQIVGFNHAL